MGGAGKGGVEAGGDLKGIVKKAERSERSYGGREDKGMREDTGIL